MAIWWFLLILVTVSCLSLILKFEFIIALAVTYSWEQEVHRVAIPCVRSTFCINNSVLKLQSMHINYGAV